MKKLIWILIPMLLISWLAGCQTAPQESTTPHVHTYADTLIYDDAGHWYHATCGCADLKESYAQHTYDAGQVFEATFDEAGYIIYTCTACGHQKEAPGDPVREHSFSDSWSVDESGHWHACLDEGYADLRADFDAHGEDHEEILSSPTETETGLARYTCGVCGYQFEKVLKISTSILCAPSVAAGTYYVGQKLSEVTLLDGEASVPGSFAWENPDALLSANGSYRAIFIPEDPRYASLSVMLSVTAVQLKVTVSAGANGTASQTGSIAANYGETLTVNFTPDMGYEVADVLVDGVSVGAVSKYTLTEITRDHTIQVSFKECPYTVQITCSEGTAGCYSMAGNTLTFTGLQADSVYQISGTFTGNIVIDVGDDFDFELEMLGLHLSSSLECPIVIRSGDKIKLTAKKDYENFIYDLREAVDSEAEDVYSASIYSQCDLVIGGKGSLTVISQHNNGIHGKDDLEVKNLTLRVECVDNALKGNDSVTVNNGTITLISKQGDGIKTTNSDISEKGNQRGTITLNGCVMDIYAACDGLDAAYNVEIDGESTVLNIYTDRYSQYSEDVEDTGSSDSGKTNYIRASNSTYSYSVLYYNSDADYTWVNATYHSNTNGMSRYYYYTYPVLSGYQQIRLYVYNSNQTQGQGTSYAYCSDYMAINSAYDTLAVTIRNNRLSTSWTNYSSGSTGGWPGGGGGGGFPGMQEGNSDKGEYSTKGIKADNEVVIHNGTIFIQSYDDAIHANKDVTLENGASPTGNVSIYGGKITAYSNDDGLHADGTLSISGGSIAVTNSYEGAEGTFVLISGGALTIVAKDDGVNATSSSGQAIIISGGYVYVHSGGDGLDSNSTTSYGGILFSGGTTVVISTSGGNSCIDSERGYSYTGGTVLALMPSNGMTDEAIKCSNFSSIGTHSNLSLTSGNYVTVTVGGQIQAAFRLPANISAKVIYLGSNSATFASTSTVSVATDANGIYWKEG